LLPSLVIAIIWLIRNISGSGEAGKATNSIHLLQTLTKTPSSSEAREIHKTILAIVAEPLSQLLESSSGSNKVNPGLSAWLASIQPQRDRRYSNTATKPEIELWTSAAGGLLDTIRNTFHSLLYWDTSLIPSAGLPTSFTYRQIDTAIQFGGATRVLRVLIDELKLLSGTPNFDPALDILSSVICARTGSLPEADFVLSLREALRLEYDDLEQVLKKGDLIYAEALVRLRRRVDVLSVVPPQADIPFEAGSGPIIPELTNIDLQDMNLEASAANADIDVAALQNAAEAHSEDIDRMLDEAAAAPMMNETDFGEGGLDVGDSMDDIFAGLTDPGSMGNFDDLDMEGMF
jgi:mediator of RNA polymerase II transcription subunit 5